MATSVTNELQEFHHFIGDKLTNGEVALSPEEAVDEWRILHPTPEQLAESVASLRLALAQADRGECVPVEQVVAEIRKKLALPDVSADE